MKPSTRTILLAPVAATGLSLLEISRTVLSSSMEGHGAAWGENLMRVLPVWITLVAASPWCGWMADRFPFRGRGKWRAFGAHLVGGALFVVLHMLLIAAYGHVAPLHGMHDPRNTFTHMYVVHATLELSMYTGIVVFLLLVDARREASERAIAEARLAQSLAAARLESLQAQIQPHFLFNTLNTLAVLARKGDGAAVDRALVDLGDLLRASFDGASRQEIPLREELDFLERYLGLQRLRFPGRLEVEWRVTEESKEALVPALLVQPLVENAIEHGLTTLQGGRITVTAVRDGAMLEIVVTDDGPGFGGGGVEGSGIGLANTRERLALLHGSRGTLVVGDAAGGGGEVRMRLPWHTRTGAEPSS